MIAHQRQIADKSRPLHAPALSLATGVDSEPESDIALVPAGAYRDHHPDSAYLVVEVAETSLAADREKAEVYAEGGLKSIGSWMWHTS